MLALVGVFQYSYAQNHTFNMVKEGIYTMQFVSKHTKDTYRIDVQIPFGYQSNKNRYPVLYALDGNVSFGMVSDIAKLLYFEKQHSAVIIVGISYTTYQEWIHKRGRDLMPNTTSTKEIDRYHTFIKDELIPLINTNFRTQKDKNIIYGHSSAGVFGFYSMFKEPLVFKNYILTSPSVDEDGGYIKQMEKNFHIKNKNLDISLYTSMGNSEKPAYINNYTQFIKQLTNSNHSGLHHKTDIFEGTHMSTMAPAFVKGFEYMFRNKEK